MDPLRKFHEEWDRAKASEPFGGTRVALATVGRDQRPAVRFVLVKEADPTGFYVYTNYDSPKADDLTSVPEAALAWHWHSTGVQVRVVGAVKRASAERSDAYFASRPRESQLGAWASFQSKQLVPEDGLQTRLGEMALRFEGRPVPRPEFWGGFCIAPRSYEFWYEGDARLHERFFYGLDGNSSWAATRLYP